MGEMIQMLDRGGGKILYLSKRADTLLNIH